MRTKLVQKVSKVEDVKTPEEQAPVNSPLANVFIPDQEKPTTERLSVDLPDGYVTALNAHFGARGYKRTRFVKDALDHYLRSKGFHVVGANIEPISAAPLTKD